MNRKKQGQILKRYYIELEKQFEQAKQLHGDAVHQYRTTYKKTRAFLRMADAKNGSHITKILPQQVRTGYHLLGGIRDMQLQQKRMLKPQEHVRSRTVAYRKILENRIGILNRQFGLLNLPGKWKKVHAATSHRLTRKDFEGFIEGKLEDVHSAISSGSFTDAILHGIRKDLKDAFYNLKLFKLSGELKSWWVARKVWLHRLLDELGDYQDRHNAIALLNANRLHALDSSEKKVLKAIRNRWSNEKLANKVMLVERMAKAKDKLRIGQTTGLNNHKTIPFIQLIK